MPKYVSDLAGALVVIALTIVLFYFSVWLHDWIQRRRQ